MQNIIRNMEPHGQVHGPLGTGIDGMQEDNFEYDEAIVY